MVNTFSWDVTPCGSRKNRLFVGTYHVHHKGDKNRMMGSYETSVLIGTTGRHIAEDGIIPSHRRETLKVT
jgi:hypothetical protein